MFFRSNLPGTKDIFEGIDCKTRKQKCFTRSHFWNDLVTKLKIEIKQN